MWDVFSYAEAKQLGYQRLADGAKLVLEANRADSRAGLYGVAASAFALIGLSAARTDKTAGAIGLVSAAGAGLLSLRQRRLARVLTPQAWNAVAGGWQQVAHPEWNRCSELANLYSQFDLPHGMYSTDRS